MTLKLIFEWAILFFVLFIGCYTVLALKDEVIVFDSNPLIIFKKFKIFIPLSWGDVQKNGEYELFFKSIEPGNTWSAKYIRSSELIDIELIDLLQKKISERKIVFDEYQNILYNPTMFTHSQLMLSKLYEIARFEGSATVDRDDRHYCDVFLIREKKSGDCLYAESKGPILNGFLEALSFEESFVTMVIL